MILQGPERPTNDANWTLEANLGQLERSSNNLGQHWPKVGPTWSQLGTNLSQVGANFESIWANLDQLEDNLGHSGPLGAIVAPTWATLAQFQPA